jgi:hypothetical protein
MMNWTMGVEMLRALLFDDYESIDLIELELSCWFVSWKWQAEQIAVEFDETATFLTQSAIAHDLDCQSS